MPTASKPGPRFALDAGTLTRNASGCILVILGLSNDAAILQHVPRKHGNDIGLRKNRSRSAQLTHPRKRRSRRGLAPNPLTPNLRLRGKNRIVADGELQAVEVFERAMRSF